MDQSEVESVNEVLPVKPLHKCPKCDRAFANIGHMKCHFYRVHPEFRLSEFEVPEISHTSKVKLVDTVMTQVTMNRTVKEELKPEVKEELPLSKIQELLFKCDKCSKCFIRKSSLLMHCISVHTDVRPFSCATCDKTFPTAFRLKSHEQTHEDNKPCRECNKDKVLCTHKWKRRYTCQMCERSFRYRSSLLTHMEEHLQDKRFKCKVCDKSFVTPQKLKMHQGTHSQERPFQCEICDRTFRRKDLLKEHYITHTDEKPYACDECGAAYRRRRSLNEHCRLHSKAKYTCHMCDKSFARQCNLARHAVIHKLDEEQSLEG